jgi:hypothetical protein
VENPEIAERIFFSVVFAFSAVSSSFVLLVVAPPA